VTILAEPDTAVAQPSAFGRLWRAALFRALVVAGALWLAFVVAHRLASGRVSWWLALDLLPPFAFVVVPLLLAGAAWPCKRSRRPVALICAASLALGLAVAGLNVSGLVGGGDGPAGPGAIRVVAWNTGFWDADEDSAAFYRLLREQDADVYALQEYLAWEDDHMVPLDGSSRLRQEFPGYHISVIGELVTLSRLPVVEERALAVPDAPPPRDGFVDYWLYKVLRTDVRTANGIVSIYNAHIPVQAWVDGPSPLDGDFYRAARQQDSARKPQFRALARDVAANPHPVLVAGDLNTTPAMGDVREFPAGLRDAQRATRSPYPVSFTASLMVRSWIPEWWRLDWTLTSPGVKVHDYDLLAPQGMSDHRMQSVVVSL
jgi:endonuclease/exonuclease/phosphatase family metal-dependent hydrolase